MVATPIGNLEDISQRALRVLSEVDLIAAEDTRRTRKLLSHFGISARVQSYYDAVEEKRTRVLLGQLAAGKTVALVSDAGTPGVSDPGYRIVTAARRHGIEVVPIPGASAVLALLSVSGLSSDRFAFEGFLPTKQGARQRRLVSLASDERTLVFFEAARRAKGMVGDLLAVFGDREAALGRELTKIHEEILRGKLSVIYALIDDEGLRGELTIAVAGRPRREAKPEPACPGDDLAKAARELASRGLGAKEIAALLAPRFGVSKREAYRLVAGRFKRSTSP